MAFPSLTRWPRDDRRVVTFYVHQHNHVLPHPAFEDRRRTRLLRQRRCGAGGPGVPRGCRTPNTRGGEPIGVLRDVPIDGCGGIAPAPDRRGGRWTLERAAEWRPPADGGRTPRDQGTRGRTVCGIGLRRDRRRLPRRTRDSREGSEVVKIARTDARRHGLQAPGTGKAPTESATRSRAVCCAPSTRGLTGSVSCENVPSTDAAA